MNRLSEAERAAAALGRPERMRRWLLEIAPAVVVGLLLLRLAGGDPWPVATAERATPVEWLLRAPLSLLPTWLARPVWALLTALAQRLVLARAGVRRGLPLGLLSAGLLVVAEPFRVVLGAGQLGTLLLALVVGDLLPRAVGERRWLPRGVATGLAVSIHPINLLFLGYAAFTARWRVALVGGIATVAFSALGVALRPRVAARAGELAWGELAWSGHLIGLLVALLGLGAAVGLHRIGEGVLAVGMVGVATCLAGSVSLGRHGWALLVGVGALQAARRWRETPSPTRKSGRGLPGWLAGLGLAYAGWAAVGGSLQRFAVGAPAPAPTVLHAVLPMLGALLLLAMIGFLVLDRGPRVLLPGRS
ncbi:hypothetical protein CGZ93_09245 [Enemella dayhoffiae]|uniref:Uncharacterized protein n=1 Tax=Enemella dayhoffiae TaxID=2016507 RepID=A0A255H351_9ACTN|nr:glycosyltransferase family 87 protein [Enemella dayhoffiae]OYO22081.1 hypothetical protein CGZ93_09245 [Enemella dayhoffiae]